MASVIAQHIVAGIQTLRNIYGTNQCCQTFQLFAGITEPRIALYIQHGTAGRQGTLGDITIAIYGVDGDNKPIGLALGTVTIASTNWSGSPGFQNPMEDAGVEFTNCTLQPNTTYALVISATDGNVSNRIYWYSRDSEYADGVSFISSDSGGTWNSLSGEDFGFRVFGDLAVPSKATNPTPANAANDVTLDQETVTWEDGGGADTYDVYYGEGGGSLVKVSSEQAGTSFTISGITSGSPFDYIISRSWRIDSINAQGTTTGDVWSFTTIRLSPPAATYWYAAGPYFYQLLIDTNGNYGSPPPGGVEDTDYVIVPNPNPIVTPRRLVVAANSKIWYEII